MRAAILTGYNEPLMIEEVTAAAMGARDVRVHIDASGVCHSDLSVANGNVPMGHPMILGHEGAGTVARRRVRGRTRGEAATASSRRSCPRAANCLFCLRDQSQLCERHGCALDAAEGHAARRQQRHRDDAVSAPSPTR